MDKLKIDAVITDLELQLETHNNPYGSYVNFRFIDVFPNFPKVNQMVAEIKNRNAVRSAKAKRPAVISIE